jgi:hypothetical protein
MNQSFMLHFHILILYTGEQSLEAGLYSLPVDDIPYGLEIIGFLVLILKARHGKYVNHFRQL